MIHRMGCGLILATLCLLAADPAFCREEGVDIRACERAFDDSGRWRYPDRSSLEASLRTAAETDAVSTLLRDQLADHPYGPFSREALTEILKTRLQCDPPELAAAPPLDFCVALDGCRMEGEIQEKFRPREIARICGLDPRQVAAQAAAVETAFAAALAADEPEGPPASVRSMMNDPEGMATERLSNPDGLIRRVEVAADPRGLEGMTCVSLVIYPIDLFAATTPTR